MDIRLPKLSAITFLHYSRFSGASGEHPSRNKRAHVARLDRNARRDRYMPCQLLRRGKNSTHNWHRRGCRVNNWNHEMDTSAGVIYMNVWYVAACSKSWDATTKRFLLGCGMSFGILPGVTWNMFRWSTRKTHYTTRTYDGKDFFSASQCSAKRVLTRFSWYHCQIFARHRHKY